MQKNEARQETIMKRAWPYLLIVGGLLIMVGGFIYDVMFAGIPYQDPTPAMEANYAFHSRIASVICWSGVGVFLFGVAAGIMRLTSQKRF